MENQGIPVYLEIGSKRIFAIVPKWPGWCRGGADEASALQALIDYAPRYKKALSKEGLVFDPSISLSDFRVEERIVGRSSADFGVPDSELPTDSSPLSPQDIKFSRTLLTACWKAFDDAAESARHRELKKGPRGGGRDLEKIIDHVHEVDNVYLKMLGGTPVDGELLWESRRHILEELSTAARDGFPAEGPRGGKRWSPVYFIRRLAWHELDHAWEIEDRVI